MLKLLIATYLDKDGGLSIPEVAATIGALPILVCPIFDWAVRGVHFDTQGYATGLGLLMVALRTAQWVKEGRTPQ